MAVQDTGAGIPAALLPTLFDPFTQGQTNQKKAEGSGLGLSLVKMFTEALGGEVTVNSTENQGTVFTVDIPFDPLPPGTMISLMDSLPFDAETLAQANIGIVFTRRYIRNTLVFHLSSWQVPHRILCSTENWAAHGPAALEAYFRSTTSQEHVYMILDGDAHLLQEVMVAARKANRSTLRVLFMSPIPDSAEARKAAHASGIITQITFLAKPLTTIKFYNCMRQLILPTSGSPTVSVRQLSADPGDSHGDEVANEYGRALAVVPKSNGHHHLNCLPENALAHTGTSLHVLIVEDNNVNQMVLSRQMEKLGVTYRVAASGPSALKVWDDFGGSVAIVFMDVEIEGDMNGLQVTSLIRAREANMGSGHKRSFIAIMTGRALEEDRREAYSSGCDDFLIKPVNMDVIKKLVTQKIGQLG